MCIVSLPFRLGLPFRTNTFMSFPILVSVFGIFRAVEQPECHSVSQYHICLTVVNRKYGMRIYSQLG